MNRRQDFSTSIVSMTIEEMFMICIKDGGHSIHF